MKKKIVIIIAIFLLILTTAAVTYALNNPVPRKPSDYKIGVKYNVALQSDKPMVALFYADWCGYCMKFMPKFKNLSTAYSGKYNFVTLNAEAPENLSLVKDVALTGYPTVYIIDPKYQNRVLLNNALYSEQKSMAVELDRYLRIRTILDSASKK